MSDYNLNDLDSIIDEHRARRFRGTTVNKKRKTTTLKVRDRCLECLREMVLPVLDSFSVRLNDEKHRTTVAHIGAVVNFRVRPHSAQSNATSALTIRRAGSDTIQMEGEISKVDGCVHHHKAFRQVSQRITHVDQRWVEKHALRFITQVLEMN